MPLLTKSKKFKSPLDVRKRIEAVLGDVTNFAKNELINSRAEYLNETKLRAGQDRVKATGKSSFTEIDSSEHLNKPDVKEAYGSFMKTLSQTSSKSSQKGCLTPLNILDMDSSIAETVKELENKQLNSSLSQDLMNTTENKAAYKKHNKDNLILDDFDFMKNFRKTNKKIRRISSSEFVKDEKNEGMNNKDVPNIKKEKRVKPIQKKEKKNVLKETTGVSKEISVYERMTLIQESRNVGLYVFCDKCDKARYLSEVKDPLELPTKWYCHMNLDEKHNHCTDPEEQIEDEEFLINNLYNAGSIVWGKVEGYPWWPAMVEDDPDTEQYFWLEENCEKPTYYHVTFFDSKQVTRAWLRPNATVPYKKNIKNHMYLPSKDSKYYSRIKCAMEQAEIATDLALIERLKKYSFINRYRKPLKKRELRKNTDKKNKAIKDNDESITKNKNKAKNTSKVSKIHKDIKDNEESRTKNKNKAKNTKVGKKREHDGVLKKDKKKFKRICTISTISNEDNISVILDEINWENSEKLDLEIIDLLS